MAPKKSKSSAAAGAGIDAVRKVSLDDIVPSPPEVAASGRPQPKVRAQAPSGQLLPTPRHKKTSFFSVATPSLLAINEQKK